jgi:hypothetical protein
LSSTADNAVAVTILEVSPPSAAGQRQHECRKTKVTLFLLSFLVSLAVFFAFDLTYSAAIKRASKTVPEPNLCRIPDPVRHHALKPNCTSTVRWGRDSYEFLTNSLGFRDETIRNVPLADVRPRILFLGDSFTEGQLPWRDSYVGKIANRLPQFDFLNGGVSAYSPSNYLNITRALLQEGYKIDEVVVFLDATAAHYEAAFYHDKDASGTVGGPKWEHRNASWYGRWRFFISSHLYATNDILDFIERRLVASGYYHLVVSLTAANVFDLEWAAWPYRRVNEADPFPSGYAPLGLQVGLVKQTAKMTLLWQELEKHNIPLIVVVYPYPGQLVRDKVESEQVRIWREWCRDRCKRFLSLYPEFFAVKDACPWQQRGCWYDKFFLYGDVHYTEVGNAMVADAVVKGLTESPPVKLPSPSLGPQPTHVPLDR